MKALKRLEDCADSQEMYERLLGEVTELLRPSRALLLTGSGPLERFKPRAAQGFDAPREFLTSGEVSLELLRSVAEQGEPLLLEDASNDPVHGQRVSVVLAGIRSVLCAPLKDQDSRVTGLVYLDNRDEPNAFRYSDLGRVLLYLERLQKALAAEPQPAEPTPAPAAPGPAPDFGPRPEPDAKALRAPAAGPVDDVPALPIRVLATFLRSLATLGTSGVSLSRAFELLAQGAEHPHLARLCQGLAYELATGHSLARSMSRFPRVFSPLHLRLVKVGESSGALDEVLRHLADYEERRSGVESRVKSALAYPAFVMAGCLAMLVLGPPFLFKGILQLLQDYQVEPSFFTSAVLALSQFSTSPALPIAALAAVVSLRLAWPRLRDRLHLAPGLGRVIQLAAVARFARAFALQLRTGITLLKALPDALEAADHPAMSAAKEPALHCLREGEGPVAALAQVQLLPPEFLVFAEVGSESGNLPEMMAWMADFYEAELERRLETLGHLLEPFIMLVMGALVAFMLLGTMLPMVQLLQTL